MFIYQNLAADLNCQTCMWIKVRACISHYEYKTRSIFFFANFSLGVML